MECGCSLPEHCHPDGRCGAPKTRTVPAKKQRPAVALCVACRDDWHAAQLGRAVAYRTQPRGVCGHPVSRPGVERCRACYKGAERRGPYYKEVDEALDRAAEELRGEGSSVTAYALANRASVSWPTARRYLARRAEDHQAAKPPVVPPHPYEGTLRGFGRHKRAGETPCLACRQAYNTASRVASGERRSGLAREWRKPCGTSAAYARHKLAGEEPCEPCRDAMRATARRRRRPLGDCGHPASRRGSQCRQCWRDRRRSGRQGHGTYAAFQRHLACGEKPCQPCWEAKRAYARRRRHFGSECGHPVSAAGVVRCAACAAAETRRLRPCGTAAAYQRHKANHEEPCEACREALREENARRYRDRKATR